MNPLYIAWQDPESRLWHTVGKLSHENNLYTFAYTGGAKASPRFKYLGRMIDLHKKYYSQQLFPLFANRILNSSRPEYPAYMRWLAMNPDTETNPMQLLARSGGERATDDLYVFAHPEKNHRGEMEMFFLSNGLRYLSPESLKRIEQLTIGDQLSLKRETENEQDCFALLLETGEQIKVGYCPRYLSRDLCEIIDKTAFKLTVARLNLDAPIQFRLLCKAVFTLPAGITLFSDSEYQTLESELIAA